MHDAPDAQDRLPLSHLTFHVLLALGNGALHGYGIIREVEEESGGRITVRSGSLYATIQRLLEQGLVEDAPAPEDDAADARRKYYRITPLGRRVVAAEGERMARLLDTARSRALAGPGATS